MLVLFLDDTISNNKVNTNTNVNTKVNSSSSSALTPNLTLLLILIIKKELSKLNLPFIPGAYDN